MAATRKPAQPYIWMLLSSFAFSWMGVLAPLAGAGYPWQVVGLVRSLVPLLLVGMWAKLDGAPLAFWGPPALWARSMAGSCSLVGTFYALTHMAPADVYTISNVFPVWIALLSWPMLGEVPPPAVWLSVLCGVLGVALVQRPDVDGFNPTALLVVAVSVFIAFAMMGLHRLKRLDPRAVVVHFSAVSAIFCTFALFCLPAEVPAELPEARHVLLLLGVGVAATIGQFYLTKAFADGAPARISVVSLTQVVFVLVLDASVLGHVPDLVKLIGALLILIPAAWIILRKGRTPLPATTP